MSSLLLRFNMMSEFILTLRHCQMISKGFFVVLCLGLSSCVGIHQGSFTTVPDDQSQQVLEALRQKETTIRTLRGLFQASVSGSGIPFSQRFNGMMSYASPDTVHLRGFLKFGVPMMDFHRQGNSYELYFPAENEMITGQVEGESQTELTQTVQLSIRAMDAVLGKIAGLSRGDIRVLKGETHYRLDMRETLSEDGQSQEKFLVRTWVDVQTLELQSIEYRRSHDDIVVSVECEDYREVKASPLSEQAHVRLPFIVTATDHRSNGGSITLNFQEFVLNAV